MSAKGRSMDFPKMSLKQLINYLAVSIAEDRYKHQYVDQQCIDKIEESLIKVLSTKHRRLIYANS